MTNTVVTATPADAVPLTEHSPTLRSKRRRPPSERTDTHRRNTYSQSRVRIRKFVLYNVFTGRFWDGSFFTATRNGTLWDPVRREWIVGLPRPHVFDNWYEASTTVNRGGEGNYRVVGVP